MIGDDNVVGATPPHLSGEFDGVDYARGCGFEGHIVEHVLPSLLYHECDLEGGSDL